ncbi:MAG: hypothetical protein NVSMB65_00770 [Chloroflexota bacterium]
MRHAGTGSAAEWDELHAQLHELEALMEETEVPPPLLSTYWELSADLIATIEEMATVVAALRTGVLDQRERVTRYRAMRQRVLGLQARTQEISLDAEGGGAETW